MQGLKHQQVVGANGLPLCEAPGALEEAKAAIANSPNTGSGSPKILETHSINYSRQPRESDQATFCQAMALTTGGEAQLFYKISKLPDGRIYVVADLHRLTPADSTPITNPLMDPVHEGQDQQKVPNPKTGADAGPAPSNQVMAKLKSESPEVANAAFSRALPQKAESNGGGGVFTYSPGGLFKISENTYALVVEGKNSEDCHACNGRLAVLYMVRSGDEFAAPTEKVSLGLNEGAWGGPPDWEVLRDGNNVFLSVQNTYTENGDMECRLKAYRLAANSITLDVEEAMRIKVVEKLDNCEIDRPK